MCNCKTDVPKEAERKCKRLGGRAVAFSEVERYGYSIIRIGHYKYDGERSKTFLYPAVHWQYCPFCGENI